MLTAPVYSTIGIPLIPGATRPVAAGTTYATVMFADLRGHGALIEQLPPLKAVSLLGEYFAMLTNAVLECGGQIFHLAEGEMMAGFGVGDSRHTQIHEALTAARTIQQRFEQLSAAWQRKYSIDTAVGIGIHRGEVAVGAFGPREHTALVLVGDAANVAAQLCRRARAGEMLLTAPVYLPHEFATPFVHLPKLQLRGRSAPMDVWCAPAATRLQMGQGTHH